MQIRQGKVGKNSDLSIDLRKDGDGEAWASTIILSKYFLKWYQKPKYAREVHVKKKRVLYLNGFVTNCYKVVHCIFF